MKTLKERFLSKINKTTYGCWIWIAGRHPYEYGMLGVEGKMLLAHRISYELYKGMIPEGLLICHHCDEPACVNPEHLYAGTSQDNMDDRWGN